MNKKIVLLVLVLCFSMVFAGCGNKPKAPDNFDKDLWEDSVKVVRIIYNTCEKDNNFSVKDENAIEEYFNTYKNRQYDNDKEYEIIYAIDDLYEGYKTYVFRKTTFSDKEYIKQSKDELIKIFDELQNQYKNIIK